MTPKEQYETRKAERARLKDLEYQERTRTESIMMLDTFDRFVTAVERIADALERPQIIAASSPRDWLTGGGLPDAPASSHGTQFAVKNG